MFLKIIQQGRTTIVQCDSTMTRVVDGALAPGSLLEVEAQRDGRLPETYDFNKATCLENNPGGAAGIWLMNDVGMTVDTIFSTH
jgi:hypothetical protein